MQTRHFSFLSTDGSAVFVYRWLPSQGTIPRGVVQIVHGMAEHAGRYEQFAQSLAQEGFLVYAADHRGHGRTAATAEDLGHFADNNGWNAAVDDILRLSRLIAEDNPGVPLFLFGHSMGSFLARNSLPRQHQALKGVVLSGSGAHPGLQGSAGKVLAKVLVRRYGMRARLPVVPRLLFAGFNARFKPQRTAFDWLSSDDVEVNRYIDDPKCGFLPTTGFFSDLLTGVMESTGKVNTANIPRHLPILFVSGENDPVGKYGKGVLQVCESFRNAGIGDVTCRLYQGGRHELLNDSMRTEVSKDVVQWLHSRSA